MPNDSRKLDGLHVHVLGWQEAATGPATMRLLHRDLCAAGARVMLTPLAAGDRTARVRSSGIRLLRSMDWAHGTDSGPRFDVSIHVGHVWRSWFGLARRNLLLAQSSWSEHKVRRLQDVDGVLCQNPQMRQAFAEHGCATVDIGWTSRDRRQQEVPRERAFFHHSSAETRTRRLLRLWQQHPEWPRLTVLVTQPAVVAHMADAENIRLIGCGTDDAELRHMQNAHLFHLCLGPAGGEGHDLGEALSVGAVTLSVVGGAMDAPRDDHGGVLVPAIPLATTTHHPMQMFSEPAMEMAIERLMAMGDSGIEAISSRARAWFLRNQQRFGRDLADAVRSLGRTDQTLPESRVNPAATSASR